MRSWLLIAPLAVVLLVASGIANAEPSDEPGRREVVHVRLDNQPITPATTRFIERALRQAEQSNTACLVIELDTPGGLLDSTHKIVRDILASRVPVVVYVSPPGSRAASAGLFITLSGHVAAMAPGTHIGAAHPVQIGGLPIPSPESPDLAAKDQRNQKDAGGEQSEQSKSGSPMADKTVNDTEAWARSLAELRGRNADWAALAVTESRSIIAREAVEQRVVDLMADDLPDLLRQLHGREVVTTAGTVRLEVANVTSRAVEMWWGERLLGVLANPNVALLLLMFGFYGILFEFYSPGWGVIGTLGVLSLILGFFGLSVLPVNYAGLALVVLALALFAAEAYVSSFGVLTLGGAACLLLGSLMLVDSPAGFMRVSLGVAAPVAIATSLIAFFLVGSVVRAQRSPVHTGSESLIGQQAVARGEFAKENGQYHGTVFIHGENWHAVSASPRRDGETAEVKGRDGLTLNV